MTYTPINHGESIECLGEMTVKRTQVRKGNLAQIRFKGEPNKNLEGGG